MQYTSVFLFVSILLQMFCLIKSSTENHIPSREFGSYDEESFDKTIDVSDKNDITQESAQESKEDERYNRRPNMGKYSI